MGERIRRTRPGWQHELHLHRQGYRTVCGIDEVGRGALAGPVVVAAVILDPAYPMLGLDDSKCLSASMRTHLAHEIMHHCIDYKVALLGPRMIEEINILQATLAAMTRAVSDLCVTPDALLIDACTLPKLPQYQVPLIKGDRQSVSIAAASILAKVVRDGIMCAYAEHYPEYGFECHKGYGTKAHYRVLDQRGETEIHRQTFLRKWRDARPQ